MSELILPPLLAQNLIRIFMRSGPNGPSISVSHMRRIANAMKPLISELIRHLIHDVQEEPDGRLIFHVPGKLGGTDRIVYDQNKDWWESDRSAGRGFAGLVARIWNQQDGAPSGGLDVVLCLAVCLGLATLQTIEKLIRPGERLPYPWLSIAESADEATAHIEYPDHRTADEQSSVGGCS